MRLYYCNRDVDISRNHFSSWRKKQHVGEFHTEKFAWFRHFLLPILSHYGHRICTAGYIGLWSNHWPHIVLQLEWTEFSSSSTLLLQQIFEYRISFQLGLTYSVRSRFEGGSASRESDVLLLWEHHAGPCVEVLGAVLEAIPAAYSVILEAISPI